MKLTSQQIFKEYDDALTFKESIGKRGISEQSKINERFFIGDQWHGANCGNERPLVRYNIIKRIADYKMSHILANPINVGFSADGIPNTTDMRTSITKTKRELASGKNFDYSSYPTTGAFYWGNINYGFYASTVSGRGLRDLHINASKSNAIYGNSTTVTPQNYKANVFIYAGKQRIPGEFITSLANKYIYADGTYSDPDSIDSTKEPDKVAAKKQAQVAMHPIMARCFFLINSSSIFSNKIL